MEAYPLIFLIGITVGFVSTVFGIGGGIIMVPLLSLLFSMSHLEAIATSLATIVFVTIFNTLNFQRKGVIVWSIVPWIAGPSICFAIISARLSLILPTQILIIIFLVFLFYLAIHTFLIKEICTRNINTKIKSILSTGIGVLSGTFSGFTGIGGGGITTPVILITGLANNIQAAPTSNAIMMFTAFFASLSYAIADFHTKNIFILGYIHTDISFLLFLGGATFSRIGVKINEFIPLSWRKTGLAIILLLVGIRFILFS